MDNERNSRIKSLLPMLLLPVIFIAVISFFFNSGGAKDKKTTYYDVVEMFYHDEVAEYNLTNVAIGSLAKLLGM